MSAVRSRILLDAGVFIAGAAKNAFTLTLLESACEEATICTAAHSLAEFYRGGRTSARESQLLNIWRPAIVNIGAPEGRLAGELLAATGGSNSMDALVIAVAQLHAISEIFTTDPRDLRLLRDARARHSRPIAITLAQ